MEEVGWKKDENPYLIFICSKCKQYSYVKTTQKTKKCLRCGRQHRVSSIINSGEIAKGMTKAVEMVKSRQNELVVKELGSVPEFRATDDFTIKSKVRRSSKKISEINTVPDFSGRFLQMIQEISGLYDEFPYYVLEFMAENYDIPLSELKILVNNSQKEGFLIRLKDNLYVIKSRR